MLRDIAHSCGGDRPLERQARNRHSRRDGQKCHDIWLDIWVERQQGCDYLHLLLEAFGEQRSDRAIDEARCEDFHFAGASLALKKAAGDFAGGVSALLVVHGEREKIEIGARCTLHADNSRQNHRIAHTGNHSGCGLLGHQTSL